MTARILVADDSVTMQKVVELTFSKEDFVLVQARSGEEAIRKAKEVGPDLVLLDLVMPDKNGYEVCAALRAEPGLRAVPIILLTGTFEPFDKEQGVRAGANDFVTKPFESQVLIGKVKQLLFSKTVEMAAPVGAGKPTPPEAPRPAPTVIPPPPHRVAPSPLAPGMTPPPIPAPGPARAVVPPPAAAPPAVPPLVAPVAAPAQVPPAGPPGRPLSSSMSRVADMPIEKSAPPPAAAAASVGAVPDLSPPTEEISQGRVWGVLDAPPTPAPPGAGDLGELNLEDLGTLPTSPPFELPSAEVATPPATLSLEELLTPLPGAFPRLEPGPLGPEVPAGEPVFDLTGEMEAPPLPLVEVGTGEPPPLSVEGFLGATEAAAPEPLGLELPEPELELPSVIPLEEAPGVPDLPGLTSLLDLEGAVGVPLAEPELVVPEAPVTEVPVPAPPSAILPVAPAVEEAPPTAMPAAVPGRAEVLGTEDMAAMRQAVTERVAHDLAHDLSDKLLERIERVVWEVVPDLAELLITKEIERIRALAEEKQSS
jgi:CheY-like chemotaxis protein